MTFQWNLTDAYAPLLPLLTSKDLLIVDAEEALAFNLLGDALREAMDPRLRHLLQDARR